MLIPVNEMFPTIQGEAKYTGTPAYFIRTQYCPVGCGWCDTKHTWEIEKKNKIKSVVMIAKTEDKPTYTEVTPEDLYNEIKKTRINHIVLTGGEPCVYDLTEVTDYFINKGYTVQIETSGTFEIKCNKNTWVTVSPKIDMDGGYKLIKESIERSDEIKYPIGKQKDVDRLIQFIDEYDLDKGQKIWVQPLSQSKKATELCVKSASNNGWNISVQTHKYINVR
jgi:7-carboxy-7-deazaguanine synthase